MRLKTLDGLALEQAEFSRAKPLLLLTYVVLEGPQERRHLAELFWPGAADPLNSLSRALSQLRQGAPGSIEADEKRVWSTLESDAQAFSSAVEAGHYAEAIAHYPGPFLAGFFLHDWSPELEEWVYAKREQLAALAERAFLALAEAEASRGRFAEGALLAERALDQKGAAEPEPEALSRYYTLFTAAEHPRAAQVKSAAAEYGVALELTPDEARNRLQIAFVGRVAERTRLEGLAEGAWAWVSGAAGMGKTALLRSLSGRYLPGRSGLPYATLEPLLGESLGEGEEAMLRRLARAEGSWLIDGWEWLDPESQTLLRRLRDLRPQVRVIIASRRSAPFRVDVEFELGPLTRDALQRFEGAWERTAGVPSLVGAFLRGEPLEAALETRLQALGEIAARVYLALALLENPDPALVRRALQLSAAETARALEELQAAGLIDPSAQVRALRAAQDLLQERPQQGGELALALARALPPRDAFPLFARSRLFWEAHDLPAVRASYLAWAEELLRRGAPQRAAELLHEAPPSEAVTLLLARALERAGRFRDALNALGDLPETPEVLALMGTLHWRLGDPEAARRAAERALEGDLAARAEAFNTLGHLARSAGEYREAASLARRAAALWQTLGNTERWVGALNNVAVALTYLGEPVEAAYREAMAAAGENPMLQVLVLLNIGWLSERRSELAEAEAAYRRVTALAEEAGSAAVAARAWNNLGVLYHKQHREAEAAEAYHRAIALAQESSERLILGMAMANLAELFGDREAWEEALRLLERAGHRDEAQAYREELPATHPFRRA